MVNNIKKGGFYLRTHFSTTLFTTGKIYKSPKDGYLTDNKGNLYHCNIDAFTDKIAVHTPTQSDWDFVIGKVREEYYNTWNQYGSGTYINLLNGMFCGKYWYKNSNYHIITIDQFRDLFKDEVNKKVYIRGHRIRGSEVIAKLESLGGVNKWGFSGSYNHLYYFISEDNSISRYDNNDKPEGLTEIFLEEPVNEEPKITKEQVELKVVEYAKSVNWDFDKVCGNVHKIGLLSVREYFDLPGFGREKIQIIFEKYKPQDNIIDEC